MSLHLTPDVLKHAYEYLCATRPFSGWNMPDADSIKFLVTNTKSYGGYCLTHSIGDHEIGISRAYVGRTESLMVYMAHEMIHVYLDGWGVKSHHGAPFHKAAKRVCQHHGFDLKRFV